MASDITEHYAGRGGLIAAIAEGLGCSGKDMGNLTPADLEPIDEFHFRGRQATLDLGVQMGLRHGAKVLDLGSGLGGTARTLATAFGCRVTGVDLTQEFCDAATTLSGWVGLSDRTAFQQGDATDLNLADQSFDAVITVHVAMNIAAKDRMYAEAKRVLKPGGRFAIYDILRGAGAEPRYPAPWAQTPDISFLATEPEMCDLLTGAGFRILTVEDSTQASLDWITSRKSRPDGTLPAIATAILFGADYRVMGKNQITGLSEGGLRTVSFICEG